MANHVSVDRLQLIEQKLVAMEPAKFQTLCDAYLAHREENIVGFSRTGSMLGKSKTTIGTPDTYFHLSDGTIGLVESTTQESDVISKIKKDISKCVDLSKTGIDVEKIGKIIVCFNSRLTPLQHTELTEFASSKNVKVELIGLDWLALELYSKYLVIAKDILGIPLDTGQLLPLGKFVEEYDNKASNLSTPLDNVFLHRIQELADINSVLKSKDILIISGFSGVGKTKIALKAAEAFVLENSGYTPFAVAKKDQDIADDLKISLHIDKDYILIIDDANRQLVTFRQILAIYKEKRKGKIKLIVTVRDYALSEILRECYEYEPHKMILPKFSNDELVTLIGSDSFKIVDHKIQRKILSISDGNARLAIMAARIAQKENERFLLSSISDLYDAYFQTFIKDFDLFSNKDLLKTIGIVSLFYSIDRSDKVFIEKLIQHFDIDYYRFNESISELESRELIEVKNTYVRISEQVMSTYFFYKVFIKDELLSYRELLFNFFEGWSHRFGDTIIPSVSSFGQEQVVGKIKPILDEYLIKIQSDEESIYRYFSVFGRFMQDDVLLYFYTKTSTLQEPLEPKYKTVTRDVRFSMNNDRTIEFLSILIATHSDNYKSALELSFEYCRKKPEELPDLLKTITDKILNYDDDYNDRNLRQVELLQMLISKLASNNQLYILSFFELVKHYLPNHYLSLKPNGGSLNRSLTVSNDTDAINLRIRIWKKVFELYANYPDEVLAVIDGYATNNYSNIKELLRFDIKYITDFFDSVLDCTIFKDIHFVHDFFHKLDRRNIKVDYKELLSKFNSKEYTVFRKLEWNTHKGRQEYTFNTPEEFKELKKADLIRSFKFSDPSDFELLLSTIKEADNANVIRHYNLSQSLDVIISSNLLLNRTLGFELLVQFMKICPDGMHTLYNPMKEVASYSKEDALTLWTILRGMNRESKIHWEMCFFSVIPKAYCDDFFKEAFLSIIRETKMHYYLPHQCLDNFIPIDEALPVKCVEAVVSILDADDSLKIQLPYHFFENYSQYFKNDLTLLQKAYIQQEQLVNNHSDIEYYGFKRICELDEKFVKNYIHSYFSSHNFKELDSYKNLSFIWDWENGEEIITECIEIIIQCTGIHPFLEHPANIFFRRLTEERSVKASSFLIGYINTHFASAERMSTVLDIIRHSIKGLFEKALLQYLKCSTDLEAFKNISWRESSSFYSGDVIIGEERAREWQEILEIVNKADDQLAVLPIKLYIRKVVESELKYAEHDRIMRFAYPGY